MKNRNRYAAVFAVLTCAAILLSGCATFPMTARDYFTNLYKRLPYKTDGDYRVIDIFYASNRNVLDDSALSPEFGNVLTDKMTYGMLSAKIDPAVTITKMMPERLQRRGVVGVQDVSKLDEDTFMKSLSNAVAASPNKSVLILVLGYKDDFETIAVEAAYFTYLLDINTPVLLFGWPGDQPVSIQGYLKARKIAVNSGPQLGRLIEQIIEKVRPGKLWINASSLGCQVVCDAFDYMHKNPSLADAETEIDHVVFAAPDVGEDDFDDTFKAELEALSKNLTTYVSSNDDALLMSSFITGEKRLGLQNLKIQNETEEAKDILYLKSLSPERVTLIDVTPINKASYGHGYYLESPDFYDDFYMRMLHKEPNVKRRLYLLKYKDNIDYWVLVGGNR